MSLIVVSTKTYFLVHESLHSVFDKAKYMLIERYIDSLLLLDSLIDAGCVEALQRVIASPAHALWPNPRERKALEDAVEASLSAAWAWRGIISSRKRIITSLPFWDGGGAEEGQQKWFKSLGQTRHERFEWGSWWGGAKQEQEEVVEINRGEFWKKKYRREGRGRKRRRRNESSR